MSKRKSKTQFVCRNSLEFFNNKNSYYVIDTGYLVEVNNTTETGFIHALKLHFSKRKIDIFKLVDSEKIDCGFCTKHNSTWYPTFTVSCAREIKITGMEYKKPIHFCYSNYTNKCIGKKLNPNSAEFVLATRKIRERDDALKFIRSRNKSPFYLENHETYEDYAKYQASLFYGRDAEKVKCGLEKAQRTKMKNYEEYVYSKKKTAFSYISETPDGKLLNSNGERHFYDLLCVYNIEQYVLTNGFYKDSIWMYDFYFPILDQYIEIAGMNSEKYNSRLIQKQQKYESLILHYRRDFKSFEYTVKSIKEKIECKILNTI